MLDCQALALIGGLEIAGKLVKLRIRCGVFMGARRISVAQALFANLIGYIEKMEQD